MKKKIESETIERLYGSIQDRIDQVNDFIRNEKEIEYFACKARASGCIGCDAGLNAFERACYKR